MSRKFVLIDHSLQDLGGHHFPYAYSVLHAAQQAGWQPELVTHRRFKERSALPDQWPVHALFRHESYSRFTLDTQAQRPDTGSTVATRWWQRLSARRAAGARTRLSHAFADDCALLWSRTSIGPGDLVFVATTSELDLAGLGLFLERGIADPTIQWHLQFHFGLFVGREPDYPAQLATLVPLRTAFSQALERARGTCRDSPLKFWCTTPQLTEQYRRLEVAPFHTLIYPVHELFRPNPSAQSLPQPLPARRIACLGHSRREKGYGQLPLLLRELWPDWFGNGRAKLVLQTHRGRQRRALERWVRELRAGASGGSVSEAALDFAPFPLPLDGYARLLCSADVGLMLYESARYYARCSGVLLEMQCAGVPVLVPAGGWLADQIEPHNQRYLDGLAAGAGSPTPFGSNDWIDVPPEAQALLLNFTWTQPAPAGVYLRVSAVCESAPADSQAATPITAIVGPRDSPNQSVHCVVRLPMPAARVSVQINRAWGTGPAPIHAAYWRALPVAPPLGATGLTIAADEQLPRLLRDVMDHIDHYQSYARAAAPDCAAKHSAASIVAALTAV